MAREISRMELLARKGRLRQRYGDDGCRLVTGCIPYRLKKRDDLSGDLISNLEVLMVSTPNRNDFVFPKGGWEEDENIYEAALRETLEEAGVRGVIDNVALGQWVFKSKSSEGSCSPGGGCRGDIFALEVTEELDSWPEQDSHGRIWVGVMESYGLCRYDWMKEALNKFIERVTGKLKQQDAEFPEPSSLCKIMASTAEHAMALC